MAALSALRDTGTLARQNANAVAITGGSIANIVDLAIADGGTGASTQDGARANLGLGTAATRNTGTSGATIPLLNGVNVFGDVMTTFRNVGGAVILGVNHAATTGYAEVARLRVTQNAGETSHLNLLVIQDSATVMALEVANHANVKQTLRLQPYGGKVEIGGPNVAYHAGNIEGTAFNFTAPQSMSNTLTMLANKPMVLDGPVGWRPILGRTNGVDRWLLRLGNDDAESGSNTGSNLDLFRNNDAGSAWTRVLRVLRDTGDLEIDSSLLSPIRRGAGVSGVLTRADHANRTIICSGGITINNSVFQAGDIVSGYNDSASTITITQGSGVTLRLNGTATTGNRTVAARGRFEIFFPANASEAVVSGAVT